MKRVSFTEEQVIAVRCMKNDPLKMWDVLIVRAPGIHTGGKRSS
jgi:hypothetical protein